LRKRDQEAEIEMSLPPRFPPLANFLIGLSKSPAVTITALRGRARGAGSEFALATDIRFASRERAVLGQVRGRVRRRSRGRALDPLPGIVGRGRAFEILVSGEDFDGERPSGTDT